MKQVLTIAGSDSGGGAGIQADLKTMTVLGVYGASAITAVTAQNTVGVQDFVALEGEFVATQLDSVLGDFDFSAAKTGMLATREIIEVIAAKVKEYQLDNLVVDPVMVATSGDVLLNKEAIVSLKEELIPLAAIITPNLGEAKVLTGRKIVEQVEVEKLAKELYDLGSAYVLVKGGHQNDNRAEDLLYDGNKLMKFSAPRLEKLGTHGTGCTLSSAIASNLAKGYNMSEAVRKGKNFVTEAIKHGVEIGKGANKPINHLFSTEANE
jgi:hydroxymethylpyrimidine kinase/phosphomethylpyrimidine kinase